MEKPPIALTKDTIAEAIFECRVSSQQALGDLLPGVLYSSPLRDQYPRQAALPFGELPRQLRDSDPRLAYQALYSLEGNDRRVLIGNRSISLSHTRPYPGWAKFKPMIGELISAVENSRLVSEVHRVSLRYVNVLAEGDGPTDLSQLRLSFALGDLPLRPVGINLRAETESNGCVTIVTVQPGATVNITAGPERSSHTGVVITVDTICNRTLTSLQSEFFDALDVVHRTEKEVFFSLLTPSTLKKLGPRWE